VGLPLTPGRSSIEQAIYQAGSRIFGSWRNAVIAAGVAPDWNRHMTDGRREGFCRSSVRWAATAPLRPGEF